MKSKDLIADALSEWRPVRNAPDLAHQLFDRLDDDEIQRLAQRAFTDEVRASLRRKDENGVPIYTSVLNVDGAGNETRIYKQTELFDVDDYRDAIASYMRASVANRAVAIALSKDCHARLGVQLRLNSA